jgi:AcrR family transcriptional regulator
VLEADGLDAVTMAAVATRVGVRAPSLYKHLRDRAELVSGVVAVAAAELTDELEGALAAAPHDPAARVQAIAEAYRSFATRNPRVSALFFADLGPDLPIPHAELARSARPVVEAAARLAGEERALPAARALTAFVHGFTSMESGGAFRLGGNVDEAFALGVDALVRGLGAPDFARQP